MCNIGRQLKHWSFVHFQSWEFIPTDSRGHLVQGWGHQIDFILRFYSLKGSNGLRIYQECVRIAAAVKALEAAPYELIIPSLSLRFRDRGACGGQNLIHASHQLATSSHRRALQRIAVRRNAASHPCQLTIWRHSVLRRSGRGRAS